MSQTPELLPCPWCHEKPSLTSGYSQQGATVECVQEKCPLNPGAYVNARPGENSSLLIDEARQEAIRKWNTRAQPAVDEALAQSTQSPVEQPPQTVAMDVHAAMRVLWDAGYKIHGDFGWVQDRKPETDALLTRHEGA